MPAMYVLGNSRGIHGASTILYEDVLEETSNLIGGDFYILPSSIQEVIAVPAADYMDADNWAEMVVDVNMTQVELNERLSNQVYFYDSSTHKLGLATAMKNTRLDDVVA